MLSKSIPLGEDVTELLTRAKALAHELQPAAATRMVEQARQVAASSGQTEAQAEVEIVAAWLSLRHGDSQSANEHAEAALLLSNLSGDALMQADAHLISARVALSHGDLDQTMVDLGMAQVKCLGTQHAPLRFHIENMLGIVHNDARQPHVSTAHFQNAQHIAQAAGLADLEAVAAANGAGVWLEIGIAAEASGDLQAAQAAWQRAVKANDEAQLLAERSNTQRAMLVIANNRSAALAHLGRLDEADQGLETAQKLAHHAPDATLTIYTALQRCRLHLRKGELAQARDAAEQGIEAAKSAGANGQLIDLYMAMSEVQEAQGDTAAAMQSLRKHLALREGHGLPDPIETARRATLAEQLHANRLAVLGKISASLVHELNQPLGAMRMLLDNACVMLEQARPGDARDNLQRMGRIVERLGRLTHQINVFAFKSTLPFTPVVLERVLAHALQTVSPRCQALAVQVTTHLQAPELAVLADAPRLEQVFINLLNNSFDAMESSATRCLHIDAAAHNGRCTITLDDTGAGIDADILARLFEPFSTTKPEGAGSGLGLMISAHIIRETGGTLGGHNLPEGGASFVIDMPLAPANPSNAP